MKKYLEYLPLYWRDYEEIIQIAKAEDSVIYGEKNGFEVLERSQWLSECGEDGISRREKMLGIKHTATQTLEERRKALEIVCSSCIPYTYSSMKRWLDGILGEGNYSLMINNEKYEVCIKVSVGKRYTADEIYKQIRRMIPANMYIVLSIIYIRHNEIDFTYNVLRGYTYRQIREKKMVEFTQTV